MIPAKQLPEPLLALLRHRDKVETFARVRCNGKQHWIAVINGSLVLLNHDYRREQALITLGGPRHFCMTLLQRWERSDLSTMPSRLRNFCDSINEKQSMRRSLKRLYCSSLAAGLYQFAEAGTYYSQQWYKIYTRIRLLLMYRCRYLNLRGLSWQLVFSTEHPQALDARGKIVRLTASILPGAHVFQLTVPSDWVEAVWKRGWAVIEEQIVLDIRITSGDGNSGIATILVEVADDTCWLARSRKAEVVRGKDMKPLVVKWLQ